MAYAETLYSLGDFLANLGSEASAGARAHFEKALAQHPAHGRSLAGLGSLLSRNGQHEEATGLFQRAVQADSTDATTYLLAAENLIEIVRQRYLNRTQGGPAPEEIIQARALLHAAVELDPELALAQAQLGYTYTFGAQDPTAGIVALERATALLPSDEAAAYNLFLLYLRAGNRAAARAIESRTLRFSRDTELRSHVRDALLRADVGLVDSLISARKPDEALALVRRVARETEDAAFREELSALALRIEAFTVNQQNTDSYNRAVDLVNSGEYAKAERILVDLVATAKDTRLKEAAAKLLDDVRRATR